MKKLLLLFIFVPSFLMAQEGDWFPVPSDQAAYFEKLGGSSLGIIKPYRIDSIVNSSEGKIYYNIRTPEVFYYDYNEEGSLHDAQASWIGNKVLIDNNEAWIYNKFDQLIYMPFESEVGEIWRLYEYENGSYIDAWFSGEANMEIVDGVNDDVKFLNFQIYDEEGNPLDSLINNETLILSKNYGFVKTYQWYQFPDNYKLGKYQLSGIELNEEKWGFDWDYDQLITSYEIGDIVHLNHYYLGSVAKEYMGKKIIGNTIEYEIKSTTPDYKTMTVEQVKYPLGIMPGQSMFNDNGEFIGYKTFDLLMNLWNGKKQYKVEDYFDFEIVEYNGQEYYYRDTYISTSGYPTQYLNDVHYYSRNCGSEGDCWNIVYYKTQDEEWGEPLEFQVEPYTMIRPDMKNIFAGHDFFGSETLLGTRIDTIEYAGYGVTRYYNYKTGEKYLYDEQREWVDPKGSWTGMYHEVDSDGVTTFFNEFYEPIVFYPQADVGFTWQAIENDNYDLEGSIISMDFQEILPGLMDSVKLIGLYSKKGEDKGSRSYFRLSKNYGLLDMPIFYRTKFNYIRNIKSIQTNDEFYGFDYQIDEIFNSLEVGHQLHYSFYDDDYSYKIKRELIAKNNYPRKVQYIYKRYQFVDQIYPVDSTYYQLVYDTIDYPQNCMPGELILDKDIFGTEFCMEIRYDTTEHCDVPLRRFDIYPFHRRVYLQVDGRILFSMWEHNGLSDQYNNDFVDKVGYYRAFQHDTDLGYDYIKYIESPNLTCGEPYIFEAERYQLFKPELIAIYGNETSYGNELLRGIKIDSIHESDTSTRLYNYRSGEVFFQNNQGREYIDPNGSWTGMYTDIRLDGKTTIYNKDYETYVFYPAEKIGFTWHVGDIETWTITGTIDTIQYQQVLPGLMDSVKILSLEMVSGEAYFNRSLRLSQNYGLLDIPHFYAHFIQEPRSMTSLKVNDVIYGINYPFDEILLSLEDGDLLHYEYPARYTTPYTAKRETTRKNISDYKVQYFINECRNYSSLDTNYFAEVVDTLEFSINVMPGELITDTTVFGSAFYMDIEYDTLYELCKDFEYLRVYPYISESTVVANGRLCYFMKSHNGFNRFDRNIFVRDLGYYKADRDDSADPYYEIQFFSNSDFNCGIPYDFSCDNSGLNELVNSSILISPNPSTGIFYITSSKKIEELKVYNLNGQLVWQVKELNKTQIDLSSLSEGLYMIKIQLDNNHVVNEKIMIQK